MNFKITDHQKQLEVYISGNAQCGNCGTWQNQPKNISYDEKICRSCHNESLWTLKDERR